MRESTRSIADTIFPLLKHDLPTAVMAGHLMINGLGKSCLNTARFSPASKEIALEVRKQFENLSFFTLINDWTMNEENAEPRHAARARQLYWDHIDDTNGAWDGLWTPEEASSVRFLPGIASAADGGNELIEAPHGRISEKYLQNSFTRMKKKNPALEHLADAAEVSCPVSFRGTSNEKCASEYFGLIPLLTRQNIRQLISFVPYCCKGAIDTASRVIAEKGVEARLINKEDLPFRIVNVFLDTEHPFILKKDAIQEYDAK